MFQSKIWFFSLNFKSISLSRKQSTCCTCSCRFIPFPSISFRVNVNDKLFQCCLLVLFMYAYGVYHTPATQSADMAGIIHIPDIFLSCFALVFTHAHWRLFHLMLWFVVLSSNIHAKRLQFPFHRMYIFLHRFAFKLFRERSFIIIERLETNSDNEYHHHRHVSRTNWFYQSEMNAMFTPRF